MSVEIRRGIDRLVERDEGRRTQHSFAFGSAYDPDNLRFGPIVCHDDHLLADGRGFDTHRHGDLVVVTYVVSGAVTHSGPTATETVPAGAIGVWRTGGSDEHSEVAAAPQTRFVQTWLADDEPPAEPSFTLVEGLSAQALPGARLDVVRLADGATATLPAAPRLHVYVARGALLRSSLAEPLQEGDAFRFVDEPARDVTAAVDTELLVWSLA